METTANYEYGLYIMGYISCIRPCRCMQPLFTLLNMTTLMIFDCISSILVKTYIGSYGLRQEPIEEEMPAVYAAHA
jgi:hypothetical protein